MPARNVSSRLRQRAAVNVGFDRGKAKTPSVPAWHPRIAYYKADISLLHLPVAPFLGYKFNVEHSQIAHRAGVPLVDLEALYRGQVTANIAKRLDVSMSDLAEFLRGTASAGMASRLNLSMNAARELVAAVAKNGAVGIVVGLLIASRPD